MAEAVKPVQETSGLVRVDHDQFVVSNDDADTLDVRAKGTLIEVGPGFLSTYTGVSYGPARVTVQVWQAEPAAEYDEWEVVEESVIAASAAIEVRSLEGRPSGGVGQIPAGVYLVRAHARGRDTATSQEVTEPVEDYLLQFWPTHRDDLAEPPVVATLKKTDRAWSDEPSNDTELWPDRSMIYVRDENGVARKVDPESDLGRAARALKLAYGGRPLEGRLSDQVYAKALAFLDRPLVDWLAQQDDEMLDEFKAVCVRASFAISGLDKYPWVHEWADRAIAQRRLDESYIDVAERVKWDPTIPKRIVPGVPSRRESLQQYEAVKTIAGFYEPVPYDALHRALEAYMCALDTFGMDGYEEFIATLRERFAVPAE
ncbi:hypothetical protein [Rhodococcus sp. H29-C3]|uniref:hypothetical protein n=1 Tax=Rhodococcus sp. H29-C3 TaxID=3046307 RepID=UPI0024B8E4CF|nr:hypothetical protein [Rhodococcus sp. H29-C3]MDJ0361848.1 hypothetical protein [Rhodococcus sp. H29-C3]